MPTRQRYQFASDNTAAICPEAWAALAEANRESAVSSYGEDAWTKRVSDQVREIFETDCETFLVFNGTAANSLALWPIFAGRFTAFSATSARTSRRTNAARRNFFPAAPSCCASAGRTGKSTSSKRRAVLAQHRDVHSTKVRALSLTQATEAGHGLFAGRVGRDRRFCAGASPFSCTWTARVSPMPWHR